MRWIERSVAVMILTGVIAGCNPGGLLGRAPVAPATLPSGAAPGSSIEGVAGGTKQFVWGEGEDRVELRLGEDFGEGDMPLHHVRVRGHDATVYQAGMPGQIDFGLVWSEGECGYTVYLDESHDAQYLAAYAERY